MVRETKYLASSQSATAVVYVIDLACGGGVYYSESRLFLI